MFKSLITILLLIALSFISNAQRKAPVLENALLWKVSGPDLPAPSYLYGTIHIACSSDIRFSDSLIRKIAEVEEVYFEASGNRRYADSILFAPGNFMKKQTLKAYIGDKNFNNIKTFITSSSYQQHISEDTLNRIKPLLVKTWIRDAGFGCYTFGYDDSLQYFSMAAGKRIAALEEKPPPGFSDLNDIHEYDQVRNLVVFSRFIPQYVNHIKQSLALYQARRINDLYDRSTRNQYGELLNNTRYTLDDRNKRWIPVMEVAMKKQATLFAFGCAHLPGKKGVIALLRKKGYTVEPIIDY